MKQYEELSNPNSCLNKAKPSEMLFILLSRDAAAPSTIRFWVETRVRAGENLRGDAQIREALACAEFMELQRKTGITSDRIERPQVRDESDTVKQAITMISFLQACVRSKEGLSEEEDNRVNEMIQDLLEYQKGLG